MDYNAIKLASTVQLRQRLDAIRNDGTHACEAHEIRRELAWRAGACFQ